MDLNVWDNLLVKLSQVKSVLYEESVIDSFIWVMKEESPSYSNCARGVKGLKNSEWGNSDSEQ